MKNKHWQHKKKVLADGALELRSEQMFRPLKSFNITQLILNGCIILVIAVIFTMTLSQLDWGFKKLKLYNQ